MCKFYSKRKQSPKALIKEWMRQYGNHQQHEIAMEIEDQWNQEMEMQASSGLLAILSGSRPFYVITFEDRGNGMIPRSILNA